MKFTEALKFIEAAQSNNPEKGKADKRVDANPDSVVDVPVAKADQALVKPKMMKELMHTALKNAGDDHETMAETMGMLVNTMLNTTFESGHLRREQLRDVVNKGEVPKDGMVHEVGGKSMIGETMDGDKAYETYESDKSHMRETVGRKLSEAYESVGDQMKGYRVMVEAMKIGRNGSK